MTFIIVYLLLALAVAFRANKRGRNGGIWFIVSALTTPVIGFIVLFCMPDLEAREQARLLEEKRHKELLEALREGKE